MGSKILRFKRSFSIFHQSYRADKYRSKLHHTISDQIFALGIKITVAPGQAKKNAGHD
jgi:hypothetical protein